MWIHCEFAFCDCCFCCWWWFVFVCRHFFPDDDMARSDSWVKEESQRIQANCLMEIQVKICCLVKVFCFLFYSWMSLDWISRMWGSCQCCWNCPLDGSKYVDVSGMDFPDVVNMFVSRMVVSCFGCFLFACLLNMRKISLYADRNSFWWCFRIGVFLPQKEGRVCFIFWKYALSLARLALSLSEAGSAWCRKAMSLILVPRKWIFIWVFWTMTVSLVWHAYLPMEDVD